MSLIKTEKEIMLLREGGKRHAWILAEAAKAVKAGMTTKELDDLIYKLIVEGGDKPSLLGYTPDGADRPFPASACISVNEEIVHGIPNEDPKTFKDGDIVGIDIGVKHKGVFTDAAVTVAVGGNKTLDDVSRKLLHATQEALAAAIKAASNASGKGNAYLGDVGYAVERVAIKYGFNIAEDLAGHGVGNAVHEDPYVPNYGRRGGGIQLKPGMVIAIEPMLNAGTGRIVLERNGYTYRTADMKRSAHFEHTVLITTGEAEILTKI